MITLMSWGHKFGNPPANYKIDCSFFKNPWRDATIMQEKNPLDRKELILSFMKIQRGMPEFIASVYLLIQTVNDFFPDENLTIAICCSAGEFRSPAIVEMIGEQLNKKNIPFIIKQNENSKL